MMAQLAGDSVYGQPSVYDLAFSIDARREMQMLEHAFERFTIGNVRRVFEPACGTGRLMYRLAKRGYQVAGNDLSPEMVHYCNARLARHGFSRAARVEDMTDFRLARPVDAMFNLLSSFRHLPNDAAALRHLNGVSQSLRPGGIYLLGMQLTAESEGTPLAESWSARRGHMAVITYLRTAWLDLQQRQESCEIKQEVYTPSGIRHIRDTQVFRTYMHQQVLDLLAGIPELQIVGAYDPRSNEPCLVDVQPETQDIVYVLQRVMDKKT